ncbi:hypothetical protein CSB93_1439 [Pseudomonas paraeruginosa]|uniref:Uncharacterized protein n=1 Tax=Pseudomonas paraeruginosa TaxID=2994495 RepID=A0A2R3IRR6_9PSED|nr:hypothetical protein CSB93_1439 [Pseudomonas paraeruginosa]
MALSRYLMPALRYTADMRGSPGRSAENCRRLALDQRNRPIEIYRIIKLLFIP